MFIFNLQSFDIFHRLLEVHVNVHMTTSRFLSPAHEAEYAVYPAITDWLSPYSLSLEFVLQDANFETHQPLMKVYPSMLGYMQSSAVPRAATWCEFCHTHDAVWIEAVLTIFY